MVGPRGRHESKTVQTKKRVIAKEHVWEAWEAATVTGLDVQMKKVTKA